MAEPVRVRRATRADTPAMLEITRDVWEGHDYVPLMWKRWLDESRGVLLVAQVGDTVAGLMHVALQADGTAWFEGIRVASPLRERGIGLALVQDGLRWCESLGLPRARLSAGGGAGAKLAERVGFHYTRTLAAFSAGPAEQPAQPGVRLAQPFDLDEIGRLIDLSQLQSGETLYTEGWTAHTLTPDRLRLLVAQHNTLLAGVGPDGIAIATVTAPFSRLNIGLLSGGRQVVENLGRELRRRAARAGLGSVRAAVEGNDEVTAGMRAAGFERSEYEMRLYERDF